MLPAIRMRRAPAWASSTSSGLPPVCSGWKGADKILNQVARGLDLSDMSPHDLVAYLDNVYSSSRYGDFDVANAIELAAMRGAGAKSDAQTASPRSRHSQLEQVRR